ncbi:MAG: ABC transporter substrate-binding protein [Gaiellaceae bacterium]
MHLHRNARLRITRRRVAALLAVATAVAALAVVTSINATSHSAQSASVVSAVTPPPPLNTSGKRGGTLNVLFSGDVDSMDPGYWYYAGDYQIGYSVGRALYGYKADTGTASPDLAASQPKITNGGKTILVKLRQGVHFGPPVNREITSADVKYAMERTFAGNVGNGYSTQYWGVLKGSPKTLAATPGDVNIAGIQTPGKFTIVFQLTKPSAPFVSSLVMPGTMPVPQEFAKQWDAQTPSKYGQYMISSGPYMVANETDGNLSKGYSPGVFIHLVRNPSEVRATDPLHPAYLDAIDIKEGVADPTVMSKQIEAGSADVNGDTPVSKTELPALLANPAMKGRLFQIPTSGSRYVALNTSKKPFNNVHVRRAVAWVLDRRAMLLTRGGPIDGSIATHFIDPSFGDFGFTQAGGFKFDPFATPNHAGSVPKAKAELKLAGFKNGLFKGPAITMVADNTPPGSDTAKVVAADLAKIGFKVKLIAVIHSQMYSKFCSVPKNEPNVCPNVGWLKDFYDPSTIMVVPFNGKSIVPSNSSNWPQLNDPAVNKAMEAAAQITNRAAYAAAWGKIDQQVTNLAAAVPWVWENFPTLFSARVVPAIQPWNEGGPDFNWISVK